MEAIPGNKQVKNGHRKGKAILEVSPDAVHDHLEMANGGQHGQDGFDHNAFIMVARFAHLEIGWIPVFEMEAVIEKDDRLPSKRAIKG